MFVPVKAYNRPDKDVHGMSVHLKVSTQITQEHVTWQALLYYSVTIRLDFSFPHF